MVWLSGIGKGRGCHSNLQGAQHIIEAPHPPIPVFCFQHSQMHGNPQKHLLGCLQQNLLPVPNHIPAQQQLKTGIVQQIIPLFLYIGFVAKQLFPGVVVQYIAPIQFLLCQILYFVVKVRN